MAPLSATSGVPASVIFEFTGGISRRSDDTSLILLLVQLNSKRRQKSIACALRQLSMMWTDTSGAQRRAVGRAIKDLFTSRSSEIYANR